LKLFATPFVLFSRYQDIRLFVLQANSAIEQKWEGKVVNSKENQLRRQSGIVAGVCGGLGEFFGINPIWFRVLFLILMLPGGLPGLLPYIVLWLVIPRR
jgi:phage shock protein C